MAEIFWCYQILFATIGRETQPRRATREQTNQNQSAIRERRSQSRLATHQPDQSLVWSWRQKEQTFLSQSKAFRVLKNSFFRERSLNVLALLRPLKGPRKSMGKSTLILIYILNIILQIDLARRRPVKHGASAALYAISRNGTTVRALYRTMRCIKRSGLKQSTQPLKTDRMPIIYIDLSMWPLPDSWRNRVFEISTRQISRRANGIWWQRALELNCFR